MTTPVPPSLEGIPRGYLETNGGRPLPHRSWWLGDTRGRVTVDARSSVAAVPGLSDYGPWWSFGVDMHLPAATYTPPADDYLTQTGACGFVLDPPDFAAVADQAAAGVNVGCWCDGSSLAADRVMGPAWDPTATPRVPGVAELGGGEFRDPLIYAELYQYWLAWVWPRIADQPTPAPTVDWSAR